MDRQLNKVQHNYNLYSINQSIIAVSHWLEWAEINVKDIDKHLVKDLRRHKNRLLNVRKQLEFINGK